MLKVKMAFKLLFQSIQSGFYRYPLRSTQFLLGLIEPERLVGINKLSTYEEYSLEAKRARMVKPVLSSYPLEKIIALKPDLVIAPDYISADVIYGLRHMGIATVVVPTPSTVDGVIQNVMEIAHIIGGR